MFEHLSQYRVIIVTGAQRSGTQLVSKAIAHDTGHTFIHESDYNVHQIAPFNRLVNTSQRAVIHAPAMMRWVHYYSASDIAVVCVNRDYDSIRRSQKRMNFSGEGYDGVERAKYNDVRPHEIDMVAQRYGYFHDVQHEQIQNVYFVCYEDMQQHPVWIPPQDRPTWREPAAAPAAPKSPNVLIVTLGYRRFGQAVVSWLKAMSHFESNGGGRYDWLWLNGQYEGDVKPYDQVLAKYREARQLFLDREYDTLICIEDDMVIPLDTFSRLLELTQTADVVYGLYTWRHGVGGGGWSAYPELSDTFGKSLIHWPDKAKQHFENSDVVDVQGVGLGCTAIKRSVLEQIDFRMDTDFHAACDWYFAADVNKHSFRQVCDMGLICGHMTLNPTPRIIYPSVADFDSGENRKFQRIEYL